MRSTDALQALAGLCTVVTAAAVLRAGDDRPIDFARDVQPILQQHCVPCHGTARREHGLRLSDRKSALAGGDSGQKAIVPGKPDQSRLIRMITGQDEKTMPPAGAKPLAGPQVEMLTQWIRQGAEWPAALVIRLPDADAPSHWAWRKPVQPVLPTLRRHHGPRNPIDCFALERLEREGLSPAAQADRHTLVRRVYLDLIGLPPSPAEVDEFVADPRPDAYERLVDRLLADPAFGERWARLWLDLARYADSKGYGSDPLRTIWRYRDWVIDAFNRNLPYDQFTIEQLAGDLLGDPDPGQILATAFHRNTMANDEGGTDDEEFRVAAIKDRVDTTGQIWMGLTVGCGKCHSHKYDPITQREYYQLFAFFNQTEDADRTDESPRQATPTRLQQIDLDRLRSEIERLKQQIAAPSPELTAGQAKWEQHAAAQESQWTLLDPVEAMSSNGTQLDELPDHTLVAAGPAPATDVYTVAADTDLAAITAFRLELVPDRRLANAGPGRHPGDGSFVLNELKVTVDARGKQPVRGRVVRVEIPGAQKILSLAEVQVFVRGANLATDGKTRQSSTDYDGPPEKAIDGNTNGQYFEAKSTTHTRTEENPWWEVDLGSLRELDRIAIWNRTDGAVGARLANFRVAVLDESRAVVWQTTVAESPRPSLSLDLAGAGAIALRNATASLESNGQPVAQAIDGDAKSGWSAGAGTGKPVLAVFETAKPLTLAPGQRLRFTLVQSAGDGRTIGRLRVAATAVSPPTRAWPAAIADVLATPFPTRTAAQNVELARFYRTIAPELNVLRHKVTQAEQQTQAIEKAIPTTPILRELPAEKRRPTHVLIKSNFLLHGDEVQPEVPEAFHGMPAVTAGYLRAHGLAHLSEAQLQRLASEAPKNRLGLALWLLDENNPLTARVAVNRFWSQLFGRGLVETEEDFGTQGLPPTHPELLDWLAVEFVRQHWDMKAILRLIVTSATYRQSSAAPPALLQRDPCNRLLSRGPRHRLEAEMVRDQGLAICGLLSRKLGGPSVYPPQPAGLWRAAFNGERTWATSIGEDRYRRGLYTFWRRTVPYPSMATFDAPSRENCTIRRIATNTPLQAFVTLNDPVFVEAAQALARRIVAEGGTSPEACAAYGLKLCLSRPAQPAQVRELAALYQQELARYRSDLAAAQAMATDPLGPLPAGHNPAELAAWTVVSNVLLNLDGVLTKR
jgi:hypothetical protein